MENLSERKRRHIMCAVSKYSGKYTNRNNGKKCSVYSINEMPEPEWFRDALGTVIFIYENEHEPIEKATIEIDKGLLKSNRGQVNENVIVLYEDGTLDLIDKNFFELLFE